MIGLVARRVALATCLTIALLSACKEQAKQQLYFEELKPPLGVGKVEVIKDMNMNPSTGGEITVLVAVEPNVDKDELGRLMESFFRQVKVRRGFQQGGKPKKIDLRFYADKAKAEAGGDDWLARVEQDSAISEPKYTNKQKPPLLKWAKNVMKPNMPLFKGDLKPQILADPDAMELEITYPMVSDDGSGKYVEKLSYAKAMQSFYATTREMFDKIENLKKMTFTGKHNDEVVMKVWMTREQYKALDMTHTLETQLHAFQGQFVELLMSKSITEKEVERKTDKRRREVFREILGRLPKEQVQLIKDLQ